MKSAPLLYNFVSLAGMLGILVLARLGGLRRGPIPWKTVLWGLAMQMVLAGLFFALPAGSAVLMWLNDAVIKLLGSAKEGIRFLFGPLANGPGEEGSLGFIFALQALPTIVFFMALTALFYQAGILQRMVNLFARVFNRWMGVSGAESVAVASNIFVGVESAGMVRPYLPEMTRSELFCILTAAMSTVASTTLGIYVTTLNHVFPSIAGHVISASIISAPAAIVVAKLMEPETGEPLTRHAVADLHMGRQAGYMEAVVQGSMDGVKLLVSIAALLLSFIGLVALLQMITTGLAGLVGLEGVGLKELVSYAAWPLAIMMGVPPADAMAVAGLMGQRALVTEIPAYVSLAGLMSDGGLVYARSAVIASYGLCGFAHVGSVAIFVGGFGALAPSRLGEMSRLGFKALLAATLATALTGCIAGLFARGGSLLLGLGG